MAKPFEFDYEADWGPYAFPRSQSRLASTEELHGIFSSADLSQSPAAAGIPLYADETGAIVNNETENTVIFGETGSKKTRCVIRPLMYSLIAKGESFFVTDPKGELATDTKIRGFLGERKYRTVFLDFRDFRGDCCNIFDHAIHLYRARQKEKAVESVGGIVNALVDSSTSSRTDPFWSISSKEYAVPIVHLLLELYAEREPEKINMGSMASLVSEEGACCLKDLLGIDHFYSRDEDKYPLKDVQNSSMTMLRGALTGSEKTTSNVMVSAFTMLQPFLFNEALLRMTSSTTFDVGEMYDKPTAVFLIVPDETSAYDKIAGILLDSFYGRLIEEFTARFQNRKTPPCRVNFVCDEFCNVAINDMGPKISACRSREIRFYLVCQSRSQLEKSYPDDAAVILGNCRNLIFLSSSDPELLDYVADRCGTTNVTDSGSPEPLVSVGMLKRLRKDRDFKEAIFLRDDLVYRAKLPDCDAAAYGFLEKYASDEPAEVPVREQKKPDVVSVEQFRYDVKNSGSLFLESRDHDTTDDTTEDLFGFRSDPIVRHTEDSNPEEEDDEESPGVEDLAAELERKFNELFGSDDDNDDGDNE